MKENKLLGDDVHLNELAKETKNYTGAEIESVCRSATNFALFAGADLSNLGIAKEGNKKGGKEELKVGERPVTRLDFENALKEVKPAFGANNEEISNLCRGGIINYGSRFGDLYQKCQDFIKEVRHSKNNPLLSVLLEGRNGCGKTALAAKLAIESNFPFVKFISPENFVGYSEAGKIQQIVKIFDDAYKSPLSLIVLDDIERLIEFIHIGPRFSNAILQALLVLVKKRPPNAERKLMIIGTTSLKSMLQEMDLVDCFNVCLNVPTIRTKGETTAVLSKFKGAAEQVSAIGQEVEQEVATEGGLPIKDMMLCVEMALQKSDKGEVEHENFMESLRSLR